MSYVAQQGGMKEHRNTGRLGTTAYMLYVTATVTRDLPDSDYRTYRPLLRYVSLCQTNASNGLVFRPLACPRLVARLGHSNIMCLA